MNIDSLELRDLRYFLACLDAGSLTAAAERLHVAQPTLSHALQRLEGAVGGSLVSRPGGRRAGLQATAAGEALAACARRLLAELSSFAEALQRPAGAVSGELQLGSIQSLNLSLLPQVLIRLRQAYPGIAVVVRTFDTSAIATAVADGLIDVALCAVPLDHQPSGLAVAELYDEDFIVLLRADDDLASRASLRLRDLATRPLLLSPPDSITGRLITDAFARAGIRPQISLSLSSGEAARELVGAGLGLSILPEGYRPIAEGPVVARPLIGTDLCRRVQLLSRAGVPRSPAVIAFSRLVQGIAAEGREAAAAGKAGTRTPPLAPS